MHQQNEVELIVDQLIARSRNNSQHQLTQDPCPAWQQEYVIRRSDLKEFVMQIASEKFERNALIERQEALIKDLEARLEGRSGKEEGRKQNKQVLYQKCVEDMEQKYEAERKKREQLDKELKWMNSKLKEQLREKEILKMSLTKFNEHTKNNSPADTNLKNGSFVTPGKEGTDEKAIGGLETLAGVNCQSIQYSYVASDFAGREKEGIKEYQTQKTKEEQKTAQFSCDSQKGRDSLTNRSNFDINKMHRHADLDKKDRVIKLLAEKSLKLEEHIDKLTKRLVGTKFSPQKPETTAPNLPKSKWLSSSEVENSGAFRVQDEQI